MAATSLVSVPSSSISPINSSSSALSILSPASLSFLSSMPGARGCSLVSQIAFPLRRLRGLPLAKSVIFANSVGCPGFGKSGLYITGVICIDQLSWINAKKETFASFDEFIAGSDKPVLVDFYATWCGPCQFMVPVLNEVSQALKDSINVAKIDTEKYPSIANHYKVEALPTLIIFKDGKPCARFEGALPADQLIQWINNSLEKVAI